MALLQSSNIQDNDNLEMLAHVEGPIVDSFYDAALLSWGKPLDPPLPQLNSPAADAPIPCHHGEQKADPASENSSEDLPENTNSSLHWDVDFEGEAKRVNATIFPRGEETPTQAVTRHLSMRQTHECEPMINTDNQQIQPFNLTQLAMPPIPTKTPR